MPDGYIFVENIARDQEIRSSKYHVHNFYELYFLVEGEINYFITDSVYHVSAANAVLISPNALHKAVTCQNPIHKRILVYFDESFFENNEILTQFDKNNGVINFPSAVSSKAFGILNTMLIEFNSNTPYRLEYLRSLLGELLVLILRNSKNKSTHYTSPKFKNVLDYIQANYSDDITLSKIADKFYVSEAHLSRTFRKNTGFSFSEYLNYTRIINARELLKNSSKNISEIALMCGFNSPTHFGRVFKKLAGVVPKEFRSGINKA